MNRAALLHIVERLESLAGRLPGAIQKAVQHELSPLKQLFLQQRPPRFLLAGSNRLSMPHLVGLVFNGEPTNESRDILFEINRWQQIEIKDRATIRVLDARGADDNSEKLIRSELNREPADVILVVSDAAEGRTQVRQSAENGIECVHWNDSSRSGAAIIAVHLDETERSVQNGEIAAEPWTDKIKQELHGRVLGGFEFSGADTANRRVAEQFVFLLAKKLPNECRVEIVRTIGDRESQREIANVLIRSTSAICAAVGAQPIPLADLPILTGLQLMMVSGVMYLSGRERSMRAATEFVGAIGANVGAGMLLREGARALLKFIPGWGNLVCGMVAGAGTYAIGHAASAYFLEGLTLGEARKRYLRGRNRRKRLQLQESERL